MRTFASGATRDTNDGKIQYEGYLSPLVLRRYGEFMKKHQIQADGKPRDPDNWQKGIPKPAYMDSAWRHFMDVWLHHRGYGDKATEPLEDALCALLFNIMGYLHEILRADEQVPSVVHIRLRKESEGWWAESDEIPGFTAVAPTQRDVERIVEQAARFGSLGLRPGQTIKFLVE